MLRTSSNVSGLPKANTRQALKIRKDADKAAVKPRVSKRTADNSPKDAPLKKRSALGDMTNAVSQQLPGKAVLKKTTKPTATKIATRRKSLPTKTKEAIVAPNTRGKAKEEARRNSDPTAEKKENLKSINEENNDSLDDYITELRTPCSDAESTEKESNSQSSQKSVEELNKLNEQKSSQNCETSQKSDNDKAETKNYIDIDADSTDPFCMAEYADTVFRNMKAKEEKFKLTNYLTKQTQITGNHRAILVDWLVEVQENFELYHETLYLAVKIVDHYLMNNTITKDKLQLVGATAMFISCKFEERHPPVLDDFLYICDDAYDRPELLDMEKVIMKTLDYNLFIPIPYRFLRRFAKAAFANMETLTLGRYILEFSLMDQDFLEYRASEMAAGSLLLALKMKNICDWTPTLVHYTEYTVEELLPLVRKLNQSISRPAKQHLMTVRNKYSHKVFFEVAKIPALDSLAL